MSTDIATIVGRNTTAINDDAKYDEADTSQDLDQGEDKFHFTIASNTEDLYSREKDQENGDPDADVNVVSPVLDSDRRGCEFERQYCQPANGIVPADSEAPGGIDESDNVSVKGTVDGVEDSEFTEGLHGAE